MSRLNRLLAVALAAVAILLAASLMHDRGTGDPPDWGDVFVKIDEFHQEQQSLRERIAPSGEEE